MSLPWARVPAISMRRHALDHRAEPAEPTDRPECQCRGLPARRAVFAAGWPHRRGPAVAGDGSDAAARPLGADGADEQPQRQPGGDANLAGVEGIGGWRPHTDHAVDPVGDPCGHGVDAIEDDRTGAVRGVRFPALPALAHPQPSRVTPMCLPGTVVRWPRQTRISLSGRSAFVRRCRDLRSEASAHLLLVHVENAAPRHVPLYLLPLHYRPQLAGRSGPRRRLRCHDATAAWSGKATASC